MLTRSALHLHCVLLVDPLPCVVLLAGQGRQAVLRFPLEAFGAYVLFGQGVQTSETFWPVRSEYKPLPQGVQFVPPKPQVP